jgi:hypothetical protein
MEKPRYKDIRAALYELKAVQFALNSELEENGGEVTESIAYKEKALASIRYMLKNGGIDHLARLLNSVEADINGYKAEQDYLKRQQKKSENFREDILECINIALEESGEDKVKGDFGYSFTQHVASSTKPDTKLIKELFYKDVEKAIRDAKVCPDHITFTLSASCNLLKEGEDMPDYFTTTSRARATYRKPSKKVDEDEFSQNEFNF